MNIQPFISHNQVIFLPGSVDNYQKMLFINTCNAMLHGRLQGESFGLACAEFSSFNKPIFSYDKSPDKHQFYALGNSIHGYNNANQLIKMLETFPFSNHLQSSYTGYADKYTPEYCMELFDRHLLFPCNKNFIIGGSIPSKYNTSNWRIAMNKRVRYFIKIYIKLLDFMKKNFLLRF